MIAFAIILHHQLPVGVLDQVVLDRNLAMLEVEQLDLRGDIGFDPIDRRRRVAHADEDQPADVLGRDRGQVDRRLVELGPHVARPKQRSVEVVGPLVVRADQLGRRPALCLADARTTMLAAVEERPHRAVAAANDNHRIVCHLKQEPVPRLPDVRHRAGIEPHARQHHLRVERERLLADVKRLR